jgi:hypothetical protein
MFFNYLDKPITVNDRQKELNKAEHIASAINIDCATTDLLPAAAPILISPYNKKKNLNIYVNKEY